MFERLEKIEKEIEVIRYAYEQNKLFLESENEAKDAYILFNKTILEFMNDTNEKILDLQNIVVKLHNNQDSFIEMFNSNARSISSLSDAIAKLSKH